MQCEKSDGDHFFRARAVRTDDHTIISWFIDKLKRENNNTRRHHQSVSESIKYVIRYFLSLFTRIFDASKNIIAHILCAFLDDFTSTGVRLCVGVHWNAMKFIWFKQNANNPYTQESTEIRTKIENRSSTWTCSSFACVPVINETINYLCLVELCPLHRNT